MQAAGFAVLVAGTLVYSRGDQIEGKQEEETHKDARPHVKKHHPTFRFNHTISRHSASNVIHRRWQRAANALRAAAHLHPDEEQPRSS